MITIEQLNSEIEGISPNNMEVLYRIAQLLQSNTKQNNQSSSEIKNPLKGSITFENDIISPIDGNWEVDL